MKTNNDHKREMLLRYMEERELGRIELSDEERRVVEDWLSGDEKASREAEEIAEHLRRLHNLPRPAVPPDLAARCLTFLQEKRQSPRFRFHYSWAWSGAVVILLVFYIGLWMDQQAPQVNDPPFLQLVHAQSYLIDKLENDLASRYQESGMTEENPWRLPIQNLKTTSKAIFAAYQSHAGDPVVERGLSIALAQNINLLKSLCDYIEAHDSIPDQDVELIDTTQERLDNAI
ncbi:MAG: hypothetical protein JXR73_20630 [Candidatus Omnitrophica bacterium]|nr:hypothetical protein [Candidatus Omnitrophota bacterium]